MVVLTVGQALGTWTKVLFKSWPLLTVSLPIKSLFLKFSRKHRHIVLTCKIFQIICLSYVKEKLKIKLSQTYPGYFPGTGDFPGRFGRHDLSLEGQLIVDSTRPCVVLDAVHDYCILHSTPPTRTHSHLITATDIINNPYPTHLNFPQNTAYCGAFSIIL